MWACLPGEAALTRIPDLLTRRFFSPTHPPALSKAWHTLRAAIQGKQDTVSTEE
jgi:hypothetical protein